MNDIPLLEQFEVSNQKHTLLVLEPNRLTVSC